MCSTNALECPLCCQTNFPNLDALRSSLVKVTSNPLKCPICAEILVGGLDKLTIHLFGHTIPIVDHFHKATRTITATTTTSSNIKRSESLKSVRKTKTGRREQTKNNSAQPTFVIVPSISSQAICATIADTTAQNNVGNLLPLAPVGHALTAVPHLYQRSPQQPQHQLQNKTTAIVLPTLTPIYDQKPKKENCRCDYCDFYFEDANILSLHMRLVHKMQQGITNVSHATASNNMIEDLYNQNAENNKFQCNLCSKYFKMKGSLRIHLKVAHLGFSNSSKKKGSSTDHGTASPGKVGHTSRNNLKMDNTFNAPSPSTHSDCSGGNIGLTSLDTNGTIQIGEEAVLTRNNNSPRSPKSPQDISKNWECDICAKTFTTKYFLKKHKRLHTGEMPYSCNICGKMFTFQQSYHKHLLYHNDEKTHICSICKRAFKELSTLNNHIRIHSGEKPFKCETCAKCFRQRVSYLVHRRIHTGQMPYKCTACDKSFRYKVSQRTHKCLSQPPGTVIRQTGDLLQKLLQSSAIITPSFHKIESPQTTNINHSDNGNLNNSNGNSISNIKGEESLFNQTLDEIVKESYEKMGMDDSTTYNNIEINDIISLTTIDEDKFRNLCLISPILPEENFPAININDNFI